MRGELGLDTASRRGLLARLRELLGGGRATTSEELEREIQDLVDQGESQGLISPREADMIEAVFELDQTTAEQIMVPRTELAMVPHTAGVREIIAVIVESGHSRIPVYADDPDHILGVIHAKDLLPHWGEEDIDLRAIMRKPYFVPLAMPLGELMAGFRRRRVHLAVVVDEYGGTAGVVTLEDVLEEIVGEIADEYDREPELVTALEDGALMVDARLEIEELAGRLGVELPRSLPEGRFETVGGFITTLLGRVPQTGEQVSYGPVHMVVEEADERRVRRVRVQSARSAAVGGEGA